MSHVVTEYKLWAFGESGEPNEFINTFKTKEAAEEYAAQNGINSYFIDESENYVSHR